MHKHIKSSGFASFRRQLALYNIKRKRKTNVQPQFSHPLLRRGRLDLLKQIKRLRQTGIKDPDQINIPLLESCRSRLVEKMVNPDGVNLMKFRIMTLDFIKEADRYIGKGLRSGCTTCPAPGRETAAPDRKARKESDHLSVPP